ncbi:MAG: tetratricopeptide repeat protein [Phycisphaerales bacterium]|nr:MAG: tetratricopeptide repeat protein [Phycisphaerales bacterium]
MIKRMSLPRIVLLLLTLSSSTILAQSASALLREGLYAEEVEGDLQAAIKVYQQVIEDESAQDSLVAQALYRQGMCYTKLKKELEAKAAFSKLVAQYGDQTQLIEKVKPLLEELGNADPASLMPPETIMYLEIGSPGKQVETILNMLKGTPFENPLAMIGGNESQWAGEDMGPANMLGALMNPSMMAEFKKIRGMGVGITGLAQNNPPAIVVLFPGQSDALRGLLLAGLGMIGRPAEAIEGMTTLHFPDGGGASYDDTVVILASPSAQAIEQLTDAVKRYKGLLGGPSLASSNASFAKISKRARQDNALTLWLNVNETYQGLMKIMPPEAIPQQIHIANGLVDFKNVDDIIASLSIEETGLALEANAHLKSGHNCVAYNLIRTPHLTKAALQAVPSEAIALVSVALGEPGTAQAEAVSEQILNATSLDIGRELFANIEQITLFAVPMSGGMEAQEGEIPPQAKMFGLTITSANPQQTRSILTSVLRSANMVASETEPVDGRYEITLANNQNVYGYMDQTNKTTVLSLNPDVITTSVAALKQGSGSGALHGALDALPETTSKLVMVNLAGAIRFGLQNADLPDDELGDQVRQAMTQLAKASEKTTIRLQTSEEDNSFGIRLSIEDLPPVGQVFGSIMQIQQAMAQIEGQAAPWSEGHAPAAGIAPAKTAPTIDGKADDPWAAAHTYDLRNSYYDAPASEADCSASFRALYDEDNLYVLVDVTDDDLQNDSEEFWLDDAVEIFIDADNSKRGSYDDNDFQYHFGWDASSPALGESQHGNMAGVEAAFARTDAGYRAEIRLPWSTLGTKPMAGTPIGLDVQVNDDDGGGERDSKVAWHAPQDDAYLHPRVFGTAQPLGLVAWWKLDETTGDETADASGNSRTGELIGSPTWKPSGGKVGGALQFDGQDDYGDTGYKTDSPTWTVVAWVKGAAAPAPGAPTGVVHREKNYQINWNHDEDEFRGGAGVCVESGWHGASFGQLEGNTWYHLAATYDGENLKAYRNGLLVTDNPDPSGNSIAEDATLKLGAHALLGTFFAGTIDDVRLYNYVLDAEAVAALAGR